VKLARARRAAPFPSVELTPMIDVVFLLIIFFMATAQFARLTRAEVDLPVEKGEQNPTPEEAGLVINITRHGEIIISNQTVTLDDLGAIMDDEIRRAPDRDPRRVKLLIRVDRHVAAGRLNEVVTRMRERGVGVARLATEIPRSTRRR